MKSGTSRRRRVHSRIVRRDGDEVEVILIEGTFEVCLARPIQHPLVDLSHRCPERRRLIDGRRRGQFLPHLCKCVTRLNRQQLGGRSGIVQIPDYSRMFAGSGAVQRFVVARRNVSSVLMDVAQQFKVPCGRRAAKRLIVSSGDFAPVLMEKPDDV